MKNTLFLILFALLAIQVEAQENIKQLFSDGDYYFVNEQYEKAAEAFEKVYEIDTTHYNSAYKIGVCYFKTPNKIWKAIPYLEQAAKSVTTDNYKDGTFKVKNAPIDVYYYLGISYQLTMQLDNARSFFYMYLENITKADFRYEEVLRRISSCDVADYYYKHPVPVEIQNVGRNINSNFSEFNPCVSANDSVMYFTREVIVEESDDFAEKQYRIMRSYKTIQNGERVWEETEDITDEFQSQANCYTLSISSDGKILLLFVDKDVYEGELGDDDGEVVITYFRNSRWSGFEKLPKEINTSGKMRDASISSNGKTIYFTSGDEQDTTGTDIYYTEKNENGIWSQAVKLDTTINSNLDEATPYIVNDTMLFFSSKGHRNIGGFDVFMSIKYNDSLWSKPENMSIPINSPLDDLGFVPVDNGKQAYFSVERPDGYLTFGRKDIFHIAIIDETKSIDSVETEEIDSVSEIVDVIQTPEPEISKEPQVKPKYEIQIFASYIPFNAEEKFDSLTVVEHYGNSGYYRYATGNYSTFKDARNNLDRIRNLGYTDAFINKTEFYENDAISFDYSKTYTVQISASVRRFNSIRKFKPLQNIAEYYDSDGIYRYLIGSFNSWSEAKKQLDEIKKLGFDGYIFQLGKLNISK